MRSLAVIVVCLLGCAHQPLTEVPPWPSQTPFVQGRACGAGAPLAWRWTPAGSLRLGDTSLEVPVPPHWTAYLPAPGLLVLLGPRPDAGLRPVVEAFTTPACASYDVDPVLDRVLNRAARHLSGGEQPARDATWRGGMGGPARSYAFQGPLHLADRSLPASVFFTEYAKIDDLVMVLAAACPEGLVDGACATAYRRFVGSL